MAGDEHTDAEDNDFDEKCDKAGLVLTSLLNKLEGAVIKPAPKNPKSSARGRYNRRKKWLAHSLEEMSAAIDQLLAQDGTIYKREEAERLKEEIERFVSATNLKPVEEAQPTEEERDRFMDMLVNAPVWTSPSAESMAEIEDMVKEARSKSDEIASRDE